VPQNSLTHLTEFAGAPQQFNETMSRLYDDIDRLWDSLLLSLEPATLAGRELTVASATALNIWIRVKCVWAGRADAGR
jgi:hypothetical protein